MFTLILHLLCHIAHAIRSFILVSLHPIALLSRKQQKPTNTSKINNDSKSRSEEFSNNSINPHGKTPKSTDRSGSGSGSSSGSGSGSGSSSDNNSNNKNNSNVVLLHNDSTNKTVQQQQQQQQQQQRRIRRKMSSNVIVGYKGPACRITPLGGSTLSKIKQRNFRKQKILVLDLDETLVHSSATWAAHNNPLITSVTQQQKRSRSTPVHTYQLDLYIEDLLCTFYVAERPFVHLFMKYVCEWYKVVIFTASVRQYADPVIDRLDKNHQISGRFFRESCTQREGVFVKDLTFLTEDLSKVIIIDNSPISYAWQPDNAIPIKSWFDDQSDRELLNLLPILDAMRFTNDVRSILRLRFS